MSTFLETVARHLIARHGNDLSRVAVVFPHKRASLWLNEYLARLSDRPVWSPTCLTITDLFRSHSERQVADNIKLVCDLHRSYTEVTGIDETLDHFYPWGQVMLSDFDDIDKCMADARQVFRHLRDLHELDDVSYLSEEQKEALRQFFHHFSDEPGTLLQKRFLQLWSRLGDLYENFGERLARQRLAYEGSLCREVVSRPLQYAFDHYAFVGFNVLQRVEQTLFQRFKEDGRATFYWDYDRYYLDAVGTVPHEAGYFVRQYLERFPNELRSEPPAFFRAFEQPKQITFVAASTEDVQARYASTWLRQEGRAAAGRQTAIVLCDEALLPTIVHSLPPEVTKANITTGYPLALSSAAVLTGLLYALQTTGRDRSRGRFRVRQVTALLRHPYVLQMGPAVADLLRRLRQEHIVFPTDAELCPDDFTQLLFTPCREGQEALLDWMGRVLQCVAMETHRRHGATGADPLQAESLFRCYTTVGRLHSLVESGDLTVDDVTLGRLLTQVIGETTIPFHGEPAEGVQVMGVLETRCLDFDHVLLLSCNEGNMPRGVNAASLIPYNIRKAYGLTTTEHKVSIYSYYFHRLLSRARDVTIVYNNATTNGRKGEMSRFMLQLLAESPHPVRQLLLQSGIDAVRRQPTGREKTPEVMETLRRRFEGGLLSPTAINRYRRCQMQFYFNYVEGLREPDEPDDDTIDNRIFGNIFHEAAWQLYEPLAKRNAPVRADDLRRLLADPRQVEQAVDGALRKELFHFRNNRERMPDLSGLQLINRQVIVHYLRQLVNIDIRLAPFRILALEGDYTEPLTIGDWQTSIGGRIDRLDCITDADGQQRIRVIDYKTGGGVMDALPDVEAVFVAPMGRSHPDYYLQTLVYASIVSRQTGGCVSPALLFIQHAGADDYDPTLCFGREPIRDIAPHRERFDQLLLELIDRIFDPSTPFTPTDERRTCDTCPYRHLCFLGASKGGE